jgi:hypothetical protein
MRTGAHEALYKSAIVQIKQTAYYLIRRLLLALNHNSTSSALIKAAGAAGDESS